MSREKNLRILLVVFLAFLLIGNNFNVFATEESALKFDEKTASENVSIEEKVEEIEKDATANIKTTEKTQAVENKIKRGTSRAIVQSGTIGTVDWTLDDAGALTFGGGIFPDNYDWLVFGGYIRGSTKTVTFTAPITAGNSLNRMFANYSLLTTINGLEKLDTANVTSMDRMFYGCNNLTSVDASNFNTSNVTEMNKMFYNCVNLASLNTSNFDTSKVTMMAEMFYQCESLTSIDVSNFDTSNCTDISYMFDGCKSLTSVDVSSFDTSKVTTIRGIFSNCVSLTSLNLGNFDTSNVTDMAYMVDGCKSLTSVDLSNFNTNKVTTFFYIFRNCESLTSLDIRNFDTSNVMSMVGIFEDCKALKTLNIRKFDTSSAVSMARMFSQAGIDKLVLGADFRFKFTDHYLYAPLSNAQYTGKWEFVETGEILTNAEFLTYDGTKPGTYMWQRMAYNVTYDTSGGSAVTGETVQNGDKVTKPTNPTKEGYTFAGWYKEAGLTNEWNFLTDLMPTNNITLYAKWNTNSYNVTYDVNGGSAVAGETVEYNSAITEPASPTKTGYTFAGWYKEANLTNEWDFTTDLMPANNITLYAKWNINSYNVTYDAKGGSPVAGETVEYNSAITEPANPTKAGYIFEGWHKDESYADKWEFLIDLVQGHTTLHAKWKAIEYQITYNLDGGTNSSNNPSTYEFAVGVAKFEDPTKEGYKFLGWFESDNGGVKITSITDTEMGDKTLFARWEKAEITGKAGTVNKYNKKGTSTGDTMNLLGVGLIFMVSAGYILTRKKKRKNNS